MLLFYDEILQNILLNFNSDLNTNIITVRLKRSCLTVKKCRSFSSIKRLFCHILEPDASLNYWGNKI